MTVSWKTQSPFLSRLMCYFPSSCPSPHSSGFLKGQLWLTERKSTTSGPASHNPWPRSDTSPHCGYFSTKISTFFRRNHKQREAAGDQQQAESQELPHYTHLPFVRRKIQDMSGWVCSKLVLGCWWTENVQKQMRMYWHHSTFQRLCFWLRLPIKINFKNIKSWPSLNSVIGKINNLCLHHNWSPPMLLLLSTNCTACNKKDLLGLTMHLLKALGPYTIWFSNNRTILTLMSLLKL